MTKYLNFFLVLILALGTSCVEKHLTSDRNYLSVIEKSFNERKSLASERDSELFSVFNNNLTVEQTDAMKFLFAFMPLNDLADYDGKFFLANVDKSLLARKEMPWGKDIPDDIFLHYVLPPRINNENLDSFRIVYYDEISNRIKGMDMNNAALEINQWCNEKVNYQSADIRTSAPMSTILSARGRCGEESTFTTAALRTAGIPSRQVYTPRWAHSDDNHAWVEIWLNGEWFYMGACEPEPVLDRGWFTEPARRAMLVHTKSFGAPLGNENSINVYRNYADINNLSKYAPVKTIFVKVVDSQEIPVSNALVEYELYNYAEFYPLAGVPTNRDGISKFETGYGDLLIWASFNGDFDYEKISVSETDTLFLKLGRKNCADLSIDLDLNVPPVLIPLQGPSADLIAQNSIRINEGNLIRQKYIASWIKPDEITDFARRHNLDISRTIKIFSRSMGNYREVASFIENTPDSLKEMALSLLEILPDKDLRDTKEKVLSDHILNCAELYDEKNSGLFYKYVLNPRIANELIVSWRSYFKENLPVALIEKSFSNPSLIVDYLNTNIKIADNENYYKTPITPRGVIDLKVSDAESRAISFVAICRTFGVPSRLEEGRNIPQYFADNSWHDVYFSDQSMPVSEKGYIKLQSSDSKPVPEYYIHFTIARFENGRYKTLEYDYNKKISEFREELSLPPGRYMLVTGNRLNDSKILSQITFFNLTENEHKILNINIRKENIEKRILGKVDFQNVINLFGKDKSSIDRIKDEGLVIIWIEPDKEPTKHVFNDLPLFKKELDEWGGSFLFLTGSTLDKNSFSPENLKGLPVKSYFATDNEMNVLHNSVEFNSPQDIKLPLVLLSDKNGNILYASAGYKIGIGEQILRNIK